MGLNAAQIFINRPEVKQTAHAPAIQNLETLHPTRSAKSSHGPRSDVMNWRAEKEGRKSSFMSDMRTNYDS